jgi:16S rRNA (guanine1207-N2)-methyltransferase
MSHYFTNDDVKSDIREIDVYIKEKEYKFYTDAGIFSKSNIDFGTKLLLESIDNIYGKVLDVGCGYGPIGIFIRKNYDCYVDMVDVNERAVNITKKNIELNNLKKINVYTSDAYSNIVGLYDFIITNPPIRAGKKKVYEILMGAKEHLKDSGNLIFVIRKEQGAKSVIKDLENMYKITILGKKSGFFIINAEKSV